MRRIEPYFPLSHGLSIIRNLTDSQPLADAVLDRLAEHDAAARAAAAAPPPLDMVELGEHCHTHIIPRLQKVIDGADQGGISKAMNWQGGGGFVTTSWRPA